MTKKTVWQGGKKVTFWTVLDENGVGNLCVEWGSLYGLSDKELCYLAIAKWGTIVQAYEEGATRVRDGGPDTCAFCHQYMDKACVGCPIAAYSGNVLCGNTPYDKYRPRTSRPYTLEFRAKEEVAFLNEVLDHIRKENDDG